MRLAVVVACLLLGARAADASPQERANDTARAATDTVLEARTSAVASELRCPVCQGLSLQDSPSQLAQSMRDVVRDQLAQGRTPEQVKAYFVSKYGEWILLAPKPNGFNLVAYAVPVIVLLAGGGVLFVAVRRWTAAAEDDDIPTLTARTPGDARQATTPPATRSARLTADRGSSVDP